MGSKTFNGSYSTPAQNRGLSDIGPTWVRHKSDIGPTTVGHRPEPCRRNVGVMSEEGPCKNGNKKAKAKANSQPPTAKKQPFPYLQSKTFLNLGQINQPC